MLEEYTKVKNATDSPREINVRLFNSISSYLKDYANTANSKPNRQLALQHAKTLVEFILEDLNVKINKEQRDLIYFGFAKILTVIEQASVNPNTIYNFSDSIGFINILAAA